MRIICLVYSQSRNIGIIDLLDERHVIGTCVSPTHTQPLRKFFMRRLKLYCSDAIRQWISHNYRTLTPYDITELLGLQLRKFRKKECA
jgi:hypothetical protein